MDVFSFLHVHRARAKDKYKTNISSWVWLGMPRHTCLDVPEVLFCHLRDEVRLRIV